MFKKPYENESTHIRGREKTKEEILKEIEEPYQTISDLEKLRNTPRKVKEESEKYPNPSEKSVITSTLEPININGQLQQEIMEHQKTKDSLDKIDGGFRKIISTVLDAVIIADDEGRIVFWNKAAEKIYGYSSKEAMRKPSKRTLLNSKRLVRVLL